MKFLSRSAELWARCTARARGRMTEQNRKDLGGPGESQEAGEAEGRGRRAEGLGFVFMAIFIDLLL